MTKLYFSPKVLEKLKSSRKLIMTLAKLFPREWSSFCAMKTRCYNKRSKNWNHYGGRGIKVCKRWRQYSSFITFLEDMGPRPTKHSLDRFPDMNGNYEPSNCRWASVKEQTRNRRTRKLLTHQGETLCVVEWAEKTGIPKGIIRNRIRAKWSVEKILTTPVDPRTGRRPNAELLTRNGKTQTIRAWLKELGMSTPCYSRRRSVGWSIIDALFIPLGERPHKKG